MNKEKAIKLINDLEQKTIVLAIRNGLVNIVPVLIVGASSLVLMTLPIPAYQSAVNAVAGGLLMSFFNIIYNATFGVLSLYMTVSISRSFMDLKSNAGYYSFGAIGASLISFFILTGAYLPGFGLENMGPKSMFLSILTGLGASSLYLYFYKRFLGSIDRLLTRGADREFNIMLSTIFPIAATAIVFAAINLAVMQIFDTDSFRSLLAAFFNSMFARIGNDFVKGFCFVLLSSLLWFFGIHGSDTLEGVMQTHFAQGLTENQAALAAGTEPTAILSKQFFDCFVLMGGCGATICLLIAILIFSKSKSTRGLGIAASLSMIFNINEMMVFGLPIIYNPVMLIPFLLVPIICYCVAYAATAAGLVPYITNTVEWTTPVILGGYTATGTAAGSMLQIVNIIIGTAIYAPFVRLLDKLMLENAKLNYGKFIGWFIENERTFGNERIIDRNDFYGHFAKELCADILYRDFIRQISLAYQPQYSYEGKCIGVESLLRINHNVYGMLYPPLVIKLAEESGMLIEFEEAVINKALSERPYVLKRFGDGVKISMNVTGATIINEDFLEFCRSLSRENDIKNMNLCLELTENTAVLFTSDTVRKLTEIKNMGFRLAVDDFSMGSTSVSYLEDGLFDIIKLDGSLVKGLSTHENNIKIIASIVSLSKSLGMDVIAEYVETTDERDVLHSVGCDIYQGYLYSMALPVKKDQ